MKRVVVLVCLALLFALSLPLESILRAEQPPVPASQKIGAGRLVGSVLTGPFRPLLLTYLWIRADTLYAQGRYDELHQLYRIIIALYPNNERARDYLGWFLAFNLKSEMPDEKLAWLWASEGLDILSDTERGPERVADWIIKQCGQNSIDDQRYAGPSWEQEKFWRRSLRAWGRRHYGEEQSRFALGLRVLAGRAGFYDQLKRTQLLESLAYEEFVRFGKSDHTDDRAIAALKAMAQETSDFPGLGEYYAERARILEQTAARRAPENLDKAFAYPVAVAFWGQGAHGKDAARLELARGILNELDAEYYQPELKLIDAWIAHVNDPKRTPRPPLPFDGMP